MPEKKVKTVNLAEYEYLVPVLDDMAVEYEIFLDGAKLDDVTKIVRLKPRREDGK